MPKNKKKAKTAKSRKTKHSIKAKVKPQTPRKKSRIDSWKKFNNDVGSVIAWGARKKLKQAKNPWAVLKYFSESLIVVLIAVGILVWLDKDINLIPYPWSAILFAVAIVVLAILHFKITG